MDWIQIMVLSAAASCVSIWGVRTLTALEKLANDLAEQRAVLGRIVENTGRTGNALEDIPTLAAFAKKKIKQKAETDFYAEIAQILINDRPKDGVAQ